MITTARPFASAALAALAALCLGSGALAQDGDAYALKTGSGALSTDPAAAGHPHRAARFPALSVAVQESQPRRLRPADAVGQGGFTRTDIGLLHRSGLDCPASHQLQLRDTGEVVVDLGLAAVTLYTPDGSDVSCTYASEADNSFMTVFASYWPQTPLMDHATAAGSLMQEYETPFGQKAEWPSIAPAAELASLIEGPVGFAYDGPDTGMPEASKREGLWVSKSKGWHLKVRVTAQPADIEPLILGAMTHSDAVAGIARTTSGTSNGLLVRFETD